LLSFVRGLPAVISLLWDMAKKYKAASRIVTPRSLEAAVAKLPPPVLVKKHKLKAKPAASSSLLTKAGVPRAVRKPYVVQAAKMSKEQWKQHQVGKAEKWPVPSYMKEARPEGATNAYRDETYVTVTRWTKDTRIEYRPHAKAPGSKSHTRYEKYGKAKTVGESLKAGSFPIDWCYDYEHGFIRVLGGPIRDEPLDSSEVDLSKLDDVDQILAKWFIREAARMLGLSLKEISEDREAKDALLLRMRRTVAENFAKEILKEQRTIVEADVLAVLRKWGFKKNYGRANVLPGEASFVFSDTVGLVCDFKGCTAPTPYTIPYPHVCRILTQYLKGFHEPLVHNFAYTSININKNYAGRLHRDSSNVGPSIIKAFGQFTGGCLNYWPNDDRSFTDLEMLPKSDAVKVDLSKNIAMFDGRRGHAVDPFNGERYTLVYFTAPRNDRAPANKKSAMSQHCGFTLPTAQVTAQALKVLGEPLGYKGPSRKPTRPQILSWPTAATKSKVASAKRAKR